MMTPDDRNLEQVYRSAVSGLYARMRSNYDFLYRKYGEQGLKTIAEMADEYGLSIADRARQRLPSNDIRSVCAYLTRIFDTVAGALDISVEAYEERPDLIAIKISRCPMQFESHEMCQAHLAMERTVVQQLNQDLDYRTGKSIPQGDSYCVHYLALRETGQTIEERTQMTINEDERTPEQVYRSAVSGLYARIRSNYDFLYRKFGDEGLALISEMSREYGLSVAERARKRLDNNDLHSVGQYLMRIFNTVGRGQSTSIEPFEETPTRISIRVTRCPLNFDIPAMCRAHTTMEKTVVETLNPSLTYRIGKSIPAGDSYCEHFIELK